MLWVFALVLNVGVGNVLAFDSRPPPSSPVFIALPYSTAQDPWRIIIPEGPMFSAQRDLQALADKPPAGLPASCVASLREGMKATRDKNFQSAETFLKRNLSDDCDDGMASFYLASVYENQSRYGEAAEILPRASELLTQNYPEHRYRAFARAALGRALFRQKRYLEASPYLEEVVKAYPEDLPHHFFAGVALCKSGSSSKGEEYLKRVLLLAEKTPRAKMITSETFLALAEQAYAEGQLQMSKQFLVHGLRQDRQNVRLQQMLSQVEKTLKDADRQHRMKGMWGAF